MAKVLKIGKNKVYQIHCEGCKTHHNINCDPAFFGPFKFQNNDVNNPTFVPELRIPNPEKNSVCQFNITEGFIIYSSNTTHKFKGQKIQLKDIKNLLK